MFNRLLLLIIFIITCVSSFAYTTKDPEGQDKLQLARHKESQVIQGGGTILPTINPNTKGSQSKSINNENTISQEPE